MNLVYGDEFLKLKQKAKSLGAKELFYSLRPNKKYTIVLKDDTRIDFGHSHYEDYLIHHDNKRRERFHARSKKIRDKNGNLTHKNKKSANFWSLRLLW